VKQRRLALESLEQLDRAEDLIPRGYGHRGGD
jgi:hypothetical protein